MALEAPETGFVWLVVPINEAIDLTVVGELHTWWTHWYRGPLCRSAMAVRCVLAERGECDWCRAGYERRARYVFPARVGDDVRLVELGRVQYPSLVGLIQFHGWIGQRLRLVRERPVKNAPISVRRLGHEVVTEESTVDCSGVVSSLGLSQLRFLTGEGALADAEATRRVTPRRR